MTLTNMNQI